MKNIQPAKLAAVVDKCNSKKGKRNKGKKENNVREKEIRGNKQEKTGARTVFGDDFNFGSLENDKVESQIDIARASLIT